MLFRVLLKVAKLTGNSLKHRSVGVMLCTVSSNFLVTALFSTVLQLREDRALSRFVTYQNKVEACGENHFEVKS